MAKVKKSVSVKESYKVNTDGSKILTGVTENHYTSRKKSNRHIVNGSNIQVVIKWLIALATCVFMFSWSFNGYVDARYENTKRRYSYTALRYGEHEERTSNLFPYSQTLNTYGGRNYIGSFFTLDVGHYYTYIDRVSISGTISYQLVFADTGSSIFDRALSWGDTYEFNITSTSSIRFTTWGSSSVTNNIVNFVISKTPITSYIPYTQIVVGSYTQEIDLSNMTESQVQQFAIDNPDVVITDLYTYDWTNKLNQLSGFKNPFQNIISSSKKTDAILYTHYTQDNLDKTLFYTEKGLLKTIINYYDDIGGYVNGISGYMEVVYDRDNSNTYQYCLDNGIYYYDYINYLDFEFPYIYNQITVNNTASGYVVHSSYSYQRALTGETSPEETILDVLGWCILPISCVSLILYDIGVFVNFAVNW